MTGPAARDDNGARADQGANDERAGGDQATQGDLGASMRAYLLRAILMSTWGVLPAVFRPLRTVFPGLGAGFLNLGGKTEGTAKKRGKDGKKWARNDLKRVGVG